MGRAPAVQAAKRTRVINPARPYITIVPQHASTEVLRGRHCSPFAVISFLSAEQCRETQEGPGRLPGPSSPDNRTALDGRCHRLVSGNALNVDLDGAEILPLPLGVGISIEL